MAKIDHHGGCHCGDVRWTVRAAASLVARLRSGVVVTLGGNAPSGVLGHASAAIELAEQIEKGDADAIDDNDGWATVTNYGYAWRRQLQRWRARGRPRLRLRRLRQHECEYHGAIDSYT